MGRLIDADALIEALKNEPSYSIELPANIGDSIQKLLAVHQKMVVDVVKKQPTACDVEKVVAELEEATVCGMGGVSFNKNVMEIIDIVKRGGIDGKEEKQA